MKVDVLLKFTKKPENAFTYLEHCYQLHKWNWSLVQRISNGYSYLKERNQNFHEAFICPNFNTNTSAENCSVTVFQRWWLKRKSEESRSPWLKEWFEEEMANVQFNSSVQMKDDDSSTSPNDKKQFSFSNCYNCSFSRFHWKCEMQFSFVWFTYCVFFWELYNCIYWYVKIKSQNIWKFPYFRISLFSHKIFSNQHYFQRKLLRNNLFFLMYLFSGKCFLR